MKKKLVVFFEKNEENNNICQILKETLLGKPLEIGETHSEGKEYSGEEKYKELGVVTVYLAEDVDELNIIREIGKNVKVVKSYIADDLFDLLR